MKLEYNEAEEFMEDISLNCDGMDDLDRLSELKQIMSKYLGDHEVELTTGYSLIWVYTYPEDGIEEDDLKRISELGFFLDEDAIAMCT